MLIHPPARDLAEQIVAAAEVAATGDDGALATSRSVYERLGPLMSVVIGDAGYRAVLSRSVRKAAATHPCLVGIVLSESDTPHDPLLVRLKPEDAHTIRQVTVAIMTNFIELLETLIGVELTLTLLDREWPRATLFSTERS